jgi:hypothetical protein
MVVTEIGTKAGPGRALGQIRTRDRVRDLAEVYTHEREVNAMLDMVPDMFPSAERPDNHDRIFLEPACGHGNFLVEILRRKLSTVTAARYKRPEDYEHRLLRCVASTYGIDIDEENVAESQDRIRDAILAHLEAADRMPSNGFVSAAEVILATNVIRADTLTNLTTITVVHYQPARGGSFLREWSPLESPDPQLSKPSQLDLFGGPAGQLDLFVQPRSDARPVHYSHLAQHPDPVSR